MAITLSNSELQEIAPILFKGIIKNKTNGTFALKSFFERLYIDVESDWTRHTTEPEDVLLGCLKSVNGKEGLNEIISEAIKDGQYFDANDEEVLKRMLEPEGYRMEPDGNGGYYLISSTPTVTVPLKQINRTWFDSHVPPNTKKAFYDATDEFSNGKWDNCLSKCRLALESMTIANDYVRALDELVKLKLILQTNPTDPKIKVLDYEMLKAVYQYCSSFGAHTLSLTHADMERASWGLLMTECSLVMLLKMLDKARNKGSNLNRWL